MSTAEHMIQFGQGNIEAFVKSGQIVATGLQDMTNLFAATAQATMNETLSTFCAMTSVRSIKEAMDLQTTLARSTMEKAMSQGGQVAEASFKLTGEALAPITSRMTVAVERLGKAG